MKTLFTSALAGKLADTASGLFGSNPLVRLGAAGVATRIAAASVPLALVALGAATFWERRRRQPAKHQKADAKRNRKTASAKRAHSAAKPAAA